MFNESKRLLLTGGSATSWERPHAAQILLLKVYNRTNQVTGMADETIEVRSRSLTRETTKVASSINISVNYIQKSTHTQPQHSTECSITTSSKQLQSHFKFTTTYSISIAYTQLGLQYNIPISWYILAHIVFPQYSHLGLQYPMCSSLFLGKFSLKASPQHSKLDLYYPISPSLYSMLHSH